MLYLCVYAKQYLFADWQNQNIGQLRQTLRICCTLKYQIFSQDKVLIISKINVSLICVQICYLPLVTGKIIIPRNCFKSNSSLCIFSVSFLWAYIPRLTLKFLGFFKRRLEFGFPIGSWPIKSQFIGPLSSVKNGVNSGNGLKLNQIAWFVALFH